jgi:hypothetical protein
MEPEPTARHREAAEKIMLKIDPRNGQLFYGGFPCTRVEVVERILAAAFPEPSPDVAAVQAGAALLEYGAHKPTCAINMPGYPPCTCGLDAALRGRR